LEQVGTWSHFRNHGRYVTARGAEKELLLEAARNGASFASETIEALRPWSGLFDGFSPERTELRPRRRRSTMMKVRLSRARQNVLKALPAVRKQIEQLAPPLMAALHRLAPHEPPDTLDRLADGWNVEGDFDEVRSGVDRLAGGEGQPGQRDVRWTPMKEEQAVGAADLGHQIRKMSPNRGATLSMTLDGMQTRLDGPAAGALNIDVTLACLCHAPHDLDVFPRLRELLDQLPRLLTKSLVDHTQLTQVPVGFVALTHFVPKLRRDVAMAGLELAVGFPYLVELPFQTALGRPGFAERPLTFFPLGAELLSLLLKLLHCVGHVDLDGEHIRFGHCADILHRSPLFLAGRLGGSAREQRSPGDRSREGFPRGSDGGEMGRTRVKLLLAPEAPRHEARHQRGGPLMAWSTPSAHDSSSRSSKGGCWDTIVEPETHPGITIAPSPSRSCRIIASPIADQEVYCGSPGEAGREKDLPGPVGRRE